MQPAPLEPSMDFLESEGESDRTEQLQARVDALRTARCHQCAAALCGHEILFTIALGASDRPRCSRCLAKNMDLSREALSDQLMAHFRQRACYHEVWNRENEREGYARETLPQCLWPKGAPTMGMNEQEEPRAPDADESPFDADATTLSIDEFWDAGDLACGDLVLALRRRMEALHAKGILKLTATDAGAVEDIPAWCRLTGHVLLSARHPDYWIQRKE